MADHAVWNVCPSCFKSYKRPEHLRRHQLSHSTERPYECAVCKSTFQRSDVLKRHLKTCNSFVDEPPDSVEPSSKRLALSSSHPLQSPELRVLDPHEDGFQVQPSSNQETFPDGISSTSYEHVAGWLSCGNNDLDSSSDSWQEFLNLNAGTQTPRVASDGVSENDGALKFLANFTSKTGLISSFDCGTLEQRQRVAIEFSSGVSEYSIRKSSAISNSSDFHMKVTDSTTASATSKDIPGQTTVRQWLSDPLSLKCHEIIISIKDIVLHKPRKSCVTFSWSPTVEETCVQFFSPANIRRYIYFYWSIWHPNVNFMHKPTFDPSSSKPELVAAMTLIGACVSPEVTDLEDAKRWFNCIEEMVFNDDDFCDEQPSPVCQDTGEVQWRREKLRALQAAYMVCLYQNWEGTSPSKRRIRRFRYSTVVAAARDIGISNARHPGYSEQKLCDFSFGSFATTEELIRTFLWIFLLDTAFVIFNNLPPRMVIREMRMSAAMPEICFQAINAEECFSTLQQETQNKSMRSNVALEFVSAFEMLYHARIDDAMSHALADLGPLNLFAMTSALHSLIFHYQNSFSCHGSLDIIQQAHLTWEKVWKLYTTRFAQDQRHSPVVSFMCDLAPEDMWRRIGFARHASEYWFLGKLMVGRLLKATEGDFKGVAGLDPTVESLGSISGTESVGPLLNQYDQTSMQQVNMLISDFQKFNIR